MIPHSRLPHWKRCLRIAGFVLICCVLLLLLVWATAALSFDVRIAWLRYPSIATYLLANATALIFLRSFRGQALGRICVLCDSALLVAYAAAFE